MQSGLMWFRRDLRANDNAALFHALRSCRQVHCVFVLDRAILDPLPRADRRVEFILESLVELDATLRALAQDEHAGLIVRHAAAIDEIPRLARHLGVQAVFANHDDEPAMRERDARILGALAAEGIALHTFKDHVIFERSEVLTKAGTPYTVFTPYRKAWLDKLDAFYLKCYPCERHIKALAARPEGLRKVPPKLAEIGFQPTNLKSLALPTGAKGAEALLDEFLSPQRIDRYHETRDFPAIKGPSYLGMHLRFGTVSIRRLVQEAQQRSALGSRGSQSWLSELAWREFFFQLLHHYPHAATGAFRPGYDTIEWERGATADSQFAAWCEGRTGYPLVDAAMRQINQTGYMHGRLRMVTSSFLVKDLGIDWKKGESYFAQKLNDYDLAINNGNWQWVASTGCDPQPWFRVLSPINQSKRFDPQGKFICRYVPELANLPIALLHEPWKGSPRELDEAGIRLGDNWALPLVDHSEARQRTLNRYRNKRG